MSDRDALLLKHNQLIEECETRDKDQLAKQERFDLVQVGYKKYKLD